MGTFRPHELQGRLQTRSIHYWRTSTATKWISSSPDEGKRRSAFECKWSAGAFDDSGCAPSEAVIARDGITSSPPTLSEAIQENGANFSCIT